MYLIACKYHRLRINNIIMLIPAWISNCNDYKVKDETTYPSPNLNGCTVKVWQWIIDFITHFTGHMIAYPCRD